MEIKVTSTGSASRMPDRLCISMTIKGSGKSLKEAEDCQSVCMSSVFLVIEEYKVDFKFLSSPNVLELTKREDTVNEETIKVEVRFVNDGYVVSQDAEIVVDGWSSARTSSFITSLVRACGGNMRSRFELTEQQLSEMSAEAMSSSYKTAVDSASHLAALETSRIYTGVTPKLKLKEAKVSASDYGVSGNKDVPYRSASKTCDSVASVGGFSTVRKPLKLVNTIEYIFEVN